MKSNSFKGPPKKKVYRSYKNFSIDTFDDPLKINLENIKDNNTYDVFEKIFLEILDKQAPLKTKILRHNNNSFMSKELRKNIMLRSKLKNSFNKDRSYENWCKYKRQRNFCVNLLRKTKRNFFKNVNEKKISDTFKFTFVSSEDVKKEIMNLNVKKSPSSKAIPATILKQSLHIYLPFLTNYINHSFVANKFPDELKLSEVILFYKKLDPLKKENYRPVSLLPHVSKVFKRMIYKQIMSYVTNLFSDYITGFRKSHGSQHCLVKMLENWKSAVDKSESVCALFMDLSKAHDLLLAKLKAYGFSREALTLMCSYLKNRKQKVVINNSASTTQTVIAGVPQGSIDGPLLFNLFINDLVLFIEYTALGNYADDNNLSITGTNIENIKKLLLADFKTVIEWFSDNYMIINPDKCKYMCMGKNSYDNDNLSLSEFNLKNSDHEIILGITIDRKLTFNKHIKNLCKKAGQKLSALLRISPYLDEN